ncbi:MAG: carboxylating nicotinate-nucleotide diphosphorylase [Methylophilaceae bacterium]
MQISDDIIQQQAAAALAEDVQTGDLTAALIPLGQTAEAQVISREAAILCGTAWFEACFRQLDKNVHVEWLTAEGAELTANQTVCRIQGDARAMLTAERCALNFLQTLSATATRTHEYAHAIAGTKATVMDTRKTLPGLRLAQKYAVTIGGGANQRMGLYDGILIKENHIAAAGSIAQALAATSCATVPVQIEVENLDDLQTAIAAGAKYILLDNFNVDALQQAVALNQSRAALEASGGITLTNIRQIAETGVDRISVGSLTKDIAAIDFSMRFITPSA